MENKILQKAKYVYFIAVAVLMYYFLNGYIDVGLHVTSRHAYALVLAFSAILLFLYKPNISRGFVAFTDACVYSVPMVVTIVVSLFIWFANTVDVDVISRGLSYSLIFTNMLSAALASAGMLYIFGQKGIWYNLVAILIANILMIFTIIAQYGLGSYMSEFITLIVTFADETGDIIINAEVHELAFCLGAYLIYMLFKPKKNIVYFILLALNLFCFLSAFKRIAMIAIAIALVFGYILRGVSKRSKKVAFKLTVILILVVIIMLIGYIVIIKAGTFELLEEAGINTSGRDGIYDAVDEFYEFSPGFLGHGIGFLTYQLDSSIHIGVASIHNDFLQHYIDLGFWGYIIWLLSMTLLRVCYFGRKGDVEGAIIAFILVIYLVIASSTDNTMNYPLLTGTIAMLMMSNNFDNRVRSAEHKMFGYISKENREEESDLLL